MSNNPDLIRLVYDVYESARKNSTVRKYLEWPTYKKDLQEYFNREGPEAEEIVELYDDMKNGDIQEEDYETFSELCMFAAVSTGEKEPSVKDPKTHIHVYRICEVENKSMIETIKSHFAK